MLVLFLLVVVVVGVGAGTAAGVGAAKSAANAEPKSCGPFSGAGCGLLVCCLLTGLVGCSSSCGIWVAALRLVAFCGGIVMWYSEVVVGVVWWGVVVWG